MMNRDSKLETLAMPFLMTLTVVIYVGGAGIPALLDDADSFYAEVAREMNLRADWITPYANELRFLEKPPLFYWLISLSYKVCGFTNSFTARLPTALAVVGLVYVTAKIGQILFGSRTGILAGLALATSIGMFLFTRIILPDALFALMLALILYWFLRWERAENKTKALLWMYAIAGLAVLTRGLIGIAFPVGIIFFTLLLSGKLRSGKRLFSTKGVLLFLVIAAPWHIAIGLRNPGFFWFYFINEHVLRFLGKRYPMDYGTVPLLPFWLSHLVWLFPWSFYLITLFQPANLKLAWRGTDGLTLPLVWALLILLFFSFSTRLEYYTLPALPALALLAARQCALIYENNRRWPSLSLAFMGVLISIVFIGISATVASGNAGSFLGLKDNPDLYAYYLGHLFDLTPESLLALRPPLLIAAFGFGIAFPLHHYLKSLELKAVSLASGMLIFFIAANAAFLIFAPRLTSKPIAVEINNRLDARSIIVIDGEYEEGCSVAYYTEHTVLIHHAPSSNLEYGSRFEDAPKLFVDNDGLRELWRMPGRRVFLVTTTSKQELPDAGPSLNGFTLATYGDKTLLSNHPDDRTTEVLREKSIDH